MVMQACYSSSNEFTEKDFSMSFLPRGLDPKNSFSLNMEDDVLEGESVAVML